MIAQLKFLIDQQAAKQFIEDLTSNYSTSTDELDKVIRQVTLLGMFSPFYKYYAVTFCGIPSFQLKGKVLDWKKLFDLPSKIVSFFGLDPDQLLANDKNGEVKLFEQNKLGQLCIWLMRVKDDVLRYFYFARNNQLQATHDYDPTAFWENFYKYHDAKQQSGGRPGVNGRTLILFPMLALSPTTYKVNDVILVNRDAYNLFLAGKTNSVMPSCLPKNVTHCTIEYHDVSLPQSRDANITFKAGFFKYLDPSRMLFGPGPVSFPRELKILVDEKDYEIKDDKQEDLSANSSGGGNQCTLI
jgi:hypothetical protein